jgi:hypothetical protein
LTIGDAMIEKDAQERGMINKLREKMNFSGKILESLNPEFYDMMERLRTADTKVREQAKDTKQIIRAINSRVRQRDYLSAATEMTTFHNQCRYIVAELARFEKSVNLKHYQFLLDQFDESDKEKLFGYNPNAEVQLDVDDDMVSTAGIKDMWHSIRDPLEDTVRNFTKQKNRAMKALEQRFSVGFLKELTGKSVKMAAESTSFASFLLSELKKLANALATRNIKDYMKVCGDIAQRFAPYHTQFVAYYEKCIEPLKQHQAELIAQKKQQEEAKEVERNRPALEQRQQMLQALEVEEQKKRQALHDKAEQMKQQPLDRIRDETLDELDRRDSEQSPIVPENTPIDLVNRKASFIANIEKAASNNDAQSLVVEILNASAALEDTNQEESLKLLAIAEGIIEDYKTAGILDMLRGKKPEEAKPEAKKEPTLPLV